MNGFEKLLDRKGHPTWRIIPLALVTSVSLLTISFSSGLSGATTNWSAPLSIDIHGGGINSISCAATTFCVAGDEDGNTLVFNGASWSSPHPTLPNRITSVSCPSVTFCEVVGSGWEDGFDGTSWGSPAEIDPEWQDLSGVSCTVDVFCFAVDESGDTYDLRGGSWYLSNSSEPLELQSLSCPITGWCAAVDLFGSVISADDGVWAPGDLQIDPDSELDTVSCAVFEYCVAGDIYGYVLTLNGSTWSPPEELESGGYVTSVSCPTTTDCVAITSDGNAYSFNGTTWAKIGTIDPNSGGLNSISCPTVTYCAAADESGQVLTYQASSAPTTTTTASSTGSTTTTLAEVTPTISVSYSPKALSAKGGTVKFTVTYHGAFFCAIFAYPKTAGVAFWGNPVGGCPVGTFTHVIRVPVNKGSRRRIDFNVYASASNVSYFSDHQCLVIQS